MPCQESYFSIPLYEGFLEIKLEDLLECEYEKLQTNKKYAKREGSGNMGKSKKTIHCLNVKKICEVKTINQINISYKLFQNKNVTAKQFAFLVH